MGEAMDLADKELLEDLQIKIKQLDSDIKIKEDELNSLKAERAKYMKELGEHSDEQYQQNILELVYEQKYGTKSKNR